MKTLLHMMLIGAALTAVLNPPTCHAQSDAPKPTVKLSAEVRDNHRAILFTFNQPDLASMEGCHYNLFAADRPSDLESLPGKGLSIATFYRPFPEVQIIAGPLPHLSDAIRGDPQRRRPRAKVFFRTLLSCPSPRSALGELISVELKTFRRGKVKGVSRLVKIMKYSMQYYQAP